MGSEVAPGRTIAGRYVVGEVIGRGGMGEVRAGHDLRLDRAVAIKLLDPEVGCRPGARERFDAEARAAARLNHPNIVVVYDSGDHGGVPFLVMERLPGRTLADELADGPLPLERIVGVGADVLAALGAAHRAGIVHRDVKPGNVLLCPDGTAKVADFGIAKAIDAADLTTTGMLLGTPAYLSPEQLASEPATPASDIYAVGVLLYEALSGSKPFTATSVLALAHAVHSSRPAPLAERAPNAPPALVAVIETAMDKEPVRRFATAEDMAEALKDALVEPSGAARSPTVPLTSADEVRSGTRALSPPTAQLPRRSPFPALAHRQRFAIALLGGLLALAVVLAVLATTGDNSPPRFGGAVPTTLNPGQPSPSVPPELNRALQRLEEVVRR